MDNLANWMQAHVLTLLLAFPAVGSVVMMALPRGAKLAVRLTAAIASGATVLIAAYLFLAYDRGAGGVQFIEQVPWVPQLGLSYHLGVDGIGISMVVLTAFIICTGSFASWTVEHRTKEFYAALFFLVTGVFGVFAAMDLFFFFLFYEIAVLPMYLLIGIWGTGPKEYAALKLTLFLLVGSAFMLIGLLGIYFFSGAPQPTFDFLRLSALSRDGAFSVGLQRTIFLLLYVGFGILAGIWPLHTWSPDGHASAPTAVSMLHAGVLMKLGAYGVLRIGVGLLPQGAVFWAPLVGGIAVVNILYGAMSAMGQTDLKYVIAYSSVSHMGVVMLGIATLNPVGLNGAVFQMFSHGIMTGLFFALVGLVYEKAHTRDMPSMGGFALRMPGIAAAFTIGGLTSFGVPGTSGFIAELLVFLGTWRVYPVLAILAVFGIVITATYVLRVLQRVFLGPFKERYEGIPDARTTEWVALVALSALLILLGVLPGPMIGLIDTAIRSFVP
ncbi:MAG TPA: NADH-quinone oxidoreductase subunit M [Armatimonadota bacterium]|nr:NADH-quinone oxidoreductase subunit M [Armatimonadota bacterium]